MENDFLLDVFPELYETQEELEIKHNEYLIQVYNKVSEIIKVKQTELYSLFALESGYQNMSDEDLKLKIAKYLTMNEKNFLKAKELSAYSRADGRYSRFLKQLDSALPFEKYGITDIDEEYGLTMADNERWFTLHLPPMIGKKQSERHAVDGRYMYYLTLKSLKDYEKKNSPIRVMKHPVLIFLHRIDGNNKLAQTIDADNVDEKLVTDAMFGYFLSDDNLLSLWTMHIGIEDKKPSCDIFIMEKETYPLWILDNQEFFSEL